YIVGNDFRMRSTSRFYPEKQPYTISVRTKSAGKASSEGVSEVITEDYRGEKVISVGRKLDSYGINWIILSEIDLKEAMMPILAMRNKILLLGASIVGIIILVTLYLSQRITRPIVQLRAIILNLAKGRLPESKPESANRDEVGQMSNAIGELIEGLRRTSSFAYEIGSGNFDSEFKPLSDDDLLGQSLLHMRDRLKELKQKEQFLARERSAALIEGQENERKRLARELHDSIGQMLTVIRIKVSLLGGSPAEQKEIKGLLDETIAEVRRVSNSVMPTVLIDFGLESGLKQLVNSTAKYAGFEIVYKYEKWKDCTINFETTISIYRIAQEAINNIIKYAEATKVELKVVQKDDCIEMLIIDNGKGFDLQSVKRKGTGIQNMKERVKLQGGAIDIQSTPGKGTQITVMVPI
ncbi:MAG TPA: ATP-binding protein, partial [Cytophagaceae bacterium]